METEINHIPTDQERIDNFKAIQAMHPANRFRLMFGMPLLPESNQAETMKPKTGKEWMAEVAALRKENEWLKNWIREEGIRSNACTYHVLGREVCGNCQCGRKVKPPIQTESQLYPPENYLH